jgi:anti-anti-sigma factor
LDPQDPVAISAKHLSISIKLGLSFIRRGLGGAQYARPIAGDYRECMSLDGVAGLDVAGVVDASGGRITAEGYLDLGTAGHFVEVVGELMRTGQPGLLALDLAEVSFCDSAGITALVKVRHECDELGWRLAVVRMSDPVRRIVVDLTGLGPFLNVLDDAATSDRRP